MEYTGIGADALFLLARNRFENSRDFYESHKEEIKQGIIMPLRAIAAEMGSLMFSIDSMMNLDPVRMVSRVRRDTRFSKDMHLYRDNLWVMFMRPKQEWYMYPCMWFEVRQECFSYGVGGYYMPPALLEVYRKHLINNEKEFVSAVKSLRKAGAQFSGETYKKPKPGSPSPAVLPYYNVKELYFSVTRTDFEVLKTDAIIDDLKKAYKAFAPLYKFLLKVSDDYMAEKEKDYEL